MNTVEIISLLGIILGLLLLIWMVMKGINIYIVAIICSVVVAVSSHLNVYNTLKLEYMDGFVNFLKANFFIFLAGTLMGKMMEITNGAKAIAKTIVRFIGKDKALISIPLACGVLAYGGVSVFVVSFAVFPIALEVFKEADLPRNYIPAALTFGCSTFAMVAPGSPQIHNVIPSQVLGTNIMAGTLNGFISCLVMLAIGTLILYRMVDKEKKAGKHFVAKPMDKFHDDEKLPSGYLALIPIVISIVLINGKINGKPIVPIETGVFIGSLLTFIILNKYQKNKEIMLHIGEACKTAIIAISSTCAVVGFGSVVRASVAFPMIVNSMINIPGPAILGAALGTTVIAGVCGSASGGLGIAVPLLAPAFLAKGIAAGALHRTMSIASAALDSLPHNGYIVTVTNGLCNESHKDAYMPIFWLTVVTPIIGTTVAVILFTLFP